MQDYEQIPYIFPINNDRPIRTIPQSNMENCSVLKWKNT